MAVHALFRPAERSYSVVIEVTASGPCWPSWRGGVGWASGRVAAGGGGVLRPCPRVAHGLGLPSPGVPHPLRWPCQWGWQGRFLALVGVAGGSRVKAASFIACRAAFGSGDSAGSRRPPDRPPGKRRRAVDTGQQPARHLSLPTARAASPIPTHHSVDAIRLSLSGRKKQNFGAD